MRRGTVALRFEAAVTGEALGVATSPRGTTLEAFARRADVASDFDIAVMENRIYPRTHWPLVAVAQSGSVQLLKSASWLMRPHRLQRYGRRERTLEILNEIHPPWRTAAHAGPAGLWREAPT
jgi:hypothetical protein